MLRSLFAAAVLLALPVTAQFDEAQPYFSLSVSRTFGPGEKPSVQLYGTGFKRLQFRLYRVNDPVKFLTGLDDYSSFGGRVVRPRGELTLLERFHAWKGRTRAAIRDLVRAQFRPQSRVEIREAMLERQRAKTRRTVIKGASAEYAAVPLLNPQQVVSVWEQTFGPREEWQSQTVPLDVSGRGVYVLEATNGDLQAYTIVCITGIVAEAKAAPGRLMARVLDRATGRPLPAAELTVWKARRQIGTFRLGAEGYGEAAPAAERDDELLLLARHGGDVAPAVLRAWNLTKSEDAQLTAYTYTDRPVYRPGHTLYFKSVLRQRTDAGYKVPAPRRIEVQIDDPEGNTVLKRTLTPGASGSLHGEWVIPASAPLGYYGMSVRAGEQWIGNAGFHVEEYRKPEYEVRVTPEKVRVLQGETVRATIEARYYFGEPVPGAKVTWVVHRTRYWPPWYDYEDEDEQALAEEEGFAGEQIEERSGVLDTEGRLTISFPAAVAESDSRYRIEARVTDAGNREITGSGVAIATRGHYFLRADADKYFYQPGERARVRVESRDYNNNPVPGIAFRVDLNHRTRGGDDKTLRSASGRTGADGAATVELPVSAGELVARAVSRSPEGRDISDAAWFWAGGDMPRWGGERRQIEIVPDRKTYAPGDTARLTLVTGVPEAWLWVTAGNESVHWSRFVHAKGGTAAVDVPIRREDAPNVFVSASFVRDGAFHNGSKSLRVPPVEHRLDVAVTASRPQFRPGEPGAFTVEAKDYQGRPVSAEFSVGVVDEAIYAIKREAAQDVLSFFYGRRWQSLQSLTSLDFHFSGEAGKRRMRLALARPPLRAQLKPGGFVDARVRRAFPDTIRWLADVRTDASGRAVVPVEFPDSLTTWRATARGITADTRVGSAVGRTIVRKNLVLRLALPRFFTEGDEVTVSAIVQNYLEGEKTARVSLEATGVEIVDGATRDVKVASRATAQVDYRVRARAPGTAVLLAKALTNEESDALELTLPVRPYGVKLSESRAGAVLGSATQADALVTIPAEANPSARTLEITVAPSVAGAMFGALDYLTSFPYGCTEQTMSSFLPNVIVARAAKDLGLRTTIDDAALEKKIRAGLDRLYDYQHEDGGWGWWKTDDSETFMTAYVVAGLARARQAGYTVRDDALLRGSAWLSGRTRERESADLAAYVAYALAEAGQPNPNSNAELFNGRTRLSPYGRALLGVALGKDARAATVAAELEQSAKQDEREAWWPVTEDPLLGIWFDATPEATAWAVKLLVAHRPASPLLPKAALWLVNHRRDGYFWASTKQTAMVVYGLADYLKASRELQPDFTATVLVNDRPVLTKRFTAADALAPAEPLRIPAVSGANRVRIRRDGPGALYWGVRAEYYTAADRLAKTGEGVLGIEREYFRLTPEKKDDRIVYRLEPVGDTVARGDILAVRVKTTGTEWKYLMIEDPIPAGTEFIERDDLYEIAERPDWWGRWHSRREHRDDRAAMFDRWFERGASEQMYLLKVNNPGRFRVSAPLVQPMYQPNVYATGAGRGLEVK